MDRIFGLIRPATTPAPIPTPATVAANQQQQIDDELRKLSALPRSVPNWVALDFWLDRKLAHARIQARLEAGRDDYLIAQQGGQRCEKCEQEITPGTAYVHQPGTGGLVQHVRCEGGEGGSR
jgi:hypothetical protein